MVAGRRRACEGATSFGCLVMLVLLGAAVYYGAQFGMVYWRYYQLRDDMQHQAALAGRFPDDSIRKTLQAQADSLLGQAPVFHIHRGGHPKRITIQAEYADSVQLPLFHKTFVLRPYAEEPL